MEIILAKNIKYTSYHIKQLNSWIIKMIEMIQSLNTSALFETTEK